MAPASLLMMQSLWGWRGAFVGTGILGFAVAAVLLMVRDSADTKASVPAPQPGSDDAAAGWRILLSPPILFNLVFFVLLAMLATMVSWPPKGWKAITLVVCTIVVALVIVLHTLA